MSISLTKPPLLEAYFPGSDFSPRGHLEFLINKVWVIKTHHTTLRETSDFVEVGPYHHPADAVC
jgi:hypothetical protein